MDDMLTDALDDASRLRPVTHLWLYSEAGSTHGTCMHAAAASGGRLHSGRLSQATV